MTATSLKPPRPGLEGLVAYLAALVGGAPAGHLVELRFRRLAGGMGQRFFPVERPDAAAAAIAVLGRRGDVYVGAALRARREGTRDALAAGWALWADCDGDAAVAAVLCFQPVPAILVRSGTGENRHGYWPLTTPLAPDDLEQANRRLARALDADLASAEPARVLRAPGSLNFKHEPPTPCSLEHLTGERFEASQLLATLPELPPAPSPAPPKALDPDDDPLRAIEPSVYVKALTGADPGRERKISCPLHSDRTPSLHVYKTPEDGWYCFGCRRGGSVYDLAAPLLGLSTRGHGFLELRRRLYELLLPRCEPPATPMPGRSGHAASARKP